MEIRCLQLLAAVALLLASTSAQVVFVDLNEASVTEGMSVEVCLRLVDKARISNSAFVTLITKDETETYVNPNSDYVPLREEFEFTAMSPNRTCVTLETLRDNAIEGREPLTIMLVNASGITTGPVQHLTILPADDKIVVDFERHSYTVTEGTPSLDLYVKLVAGSVERAFPTTVEVEFSRSESEDYIQPSSITFYTGNSTGTTMLVSLSIRDDQQVEGTENFQISIIGTQDVTPSGRGVVTITVIDNDMAYVDLVTTSTSQLEGDSEDVEAVSVQVCVQLVLDPALPLARTVVVLLSTRDVTTDNSDYSLPEALLAFQPGSTSTTTLCTALEIVGDNNEEMDEELVVQIIPVEPDVTLGGVDKMLTITILNDDVNCKALPQPIHPVVLDPPDSLMQGAMVRYLCATGYRLVGSNKRSCMNGNWTGTEPTCTILDCGEPPLLKNGDVIVNTTTVNNTAEYFCVEGFRQKEDTVHVIQCQNDGTWTQPDIECVNDPDEKGLSTQESNDHLGGGGIAAVTIASTLLVVAAVLLVVVMLGYCYLTKHKSGMKRSGKYVVDNSEIYGDEPKVMNNSIVLSKVDSKIETSSPALEDDFLHRHSDSPTDV